MAGLWEKTRQGRLGSDIIRFAIFKRSLWLLSSMVDRWSRGVRAEAHRIGKGASHVWVCFPRAKSVFRAASSEYFGDVCPDTFSGLGNVGLRCEAAD